MALQPLTLADLQQAQPIVDRDGRPSAVLLRTLNGNNRNIKQIVNALASQLAQIQEALGLAEASVRETARINSNVAPTAVLTAEDAGSDAKIIVADHVRVYPVRGDVDVPDVAITGAEITGLDFATAYYVYYDDHTLADTTPSFQVTEIINEAQPSAAAGRHFVGGITTPTDGGAPTDGGGPLPPGGGGGPQDEQPI